MTQASIHGRHQDRFAPQHGHANENDNENEGEGNWSAARRHDKGVQHMMKYGKVAIGARKARDAMDGSEDEEMKRAEEEEAKEEAKDLARE